MISQFSIFNLDDDLAFVVCCVKHDSTSNISHRSRDTIISTGEAVLAGQGVHRRGLLILFMCIFNIQTGRLTMATVIEVHFLLYNVVMVLYVRA